MVIDVYIDVDEALDYAKNRLGDLHKKANMAVRTAINKSAKEIKKLDERKAKQVYTAKNEINNLEFTRATTGNLQAILYDKDENIGVSKYMHYSGGRIGVSAVINKLHGRKRITKYGNKTFTAEMKSGHKGVFVRVPGTIMQYSKTRYKRKGIPRKTDYENKHIDMIEEIKSISSPVIHGNPAIWSQVEPNAKEIMYKYLDEEIERILSK